MASPSSGGAGVGFNPGPARKVKTSGDFNGDDKSDILWQSTDGTAGVWMMNGFSVLHSWVSPG